MFKLLEITNFQSHKNTVLHFHKGMNVIIGRSDTGKSAILRSLHLLINNRPGGDSYRSNWGGDTSVALTTSEAVKVSRNKNKKANSYELSTFDEPFLAFGQDVPKEIREALNVDEINVQKQLDSHFLLSETSGNVATHFNKIAKLEKIDKSRNYIQSEINKINENLKQERKTIKEKTEQEESFAFIDDLRIKLEAVSILVAENDEHIKSVNELNTLIWDINVIENRISKMELILKPEKAINIILSLIEKREILNASYTSLRKLSLEIYYGVEKQETFETQLLAEPLINKILKQYASLSQTSENTILLQKLSTNIELKESKQKRYSKQLEELEKDFHENYPKVCPFCNSKTK